MSRFALSIVVEIDADTEEDAYEAFNKIMFERDIEVDWQIYGGIEVDE
jgi:hypothetical protein